MVCNSMVPLGSLLVRSGLQVERFLRRRCQSPQATDALSRGFAANALRTMRSTVTYDLDTHFDFN